MRKKLLTGMILAVTLGAQTPLYVRTGGHYNGRMWRAQSFAEKAGFLTGFNAASLYIKAIQLGKCYACDTVPNGYTNIELAQMLDIFYRTPENAPIPISWALDVLYRRLDQKMSPKQEAQYMQALRQDVASLPQESQ